MRAVVLTGHGGPEVLRVEERPDPAVGPGEVRIDVRAAGINFADTMARVGLYPDAPKPPCVLGYEIAGEVESVGEGVTDYKVGDRVVAGTRFGGQASLVTVPAGQVLRLPASSRARRFRSTTRRRTAALWSWAGSRRANALSYTPLPAG
jgi:NADPH:quinone reductase-like Zn-dependent oxidoreductase